ncbi:MAG: cytochrome C [Phycisphaeraceae bacterium]
MNARFENILGPRIPADTWRQHPVRYLLPSALLLLAAILLIASIFTPYWKMTLHAPQYPGGLHVTAYLDRLEGDVQEVDGLNHYIGMRPLGEAAQLERTLGIYMVVALALLLLASIVTHNWWALLLALPAILFPPFFLLDLYYWLSTFGQNLDPTAPLSSAIKPFTPPVLGEGKVGQFRTVATPGIGLILASISSLVILIALWFHRVAYKPIVDARKHRHDTQAQAGPERSEGPDR